MASAAAASRTSSNLKESSSTTSRQRRGRRRRCRLVLLRLVLGLGIVAIICGSYWQQQLLALSSSATTMDGTTTTASNSSAASLWAQQQIWAHAGLPANLIYNNNNNKHNVSQIMHDDTNNNNNKTIASADASPLPLLLPLGFQSVLERSKRFQQDCDAIIPKTKHSEQKSSSNETLGIADLPDFGIVDALESYSSMKNNNNTQQQFEQCTVPPETECNETQFTVVFMGYNPERLNPMKRQVSNMLSNRQWKAIVHRIVLVWNGPHNLTQTSVGKELQQLSQQRGESYNRFTIVYPLEQGFPNDLMNRYHPQLLNISSTTRTKAILFYDDDGPFYSYNAIVSGFELWKRNANRQIGAMARRLDVKTQRQIDEQTHARSEGNETFIKNCRTAGDVLEYNFREFANYQARMVLPSGSFLHANYLCFLWHPALEPLRTFVRAHPVHPDDMTVSTVVSHIAGRSPLVYSRRINAADPADTTKPPIVVTAQQASNETTQRRRLQQRQWQEDYEYDSYPRRRRLLWQDEHEHDWGTMRAMAVNSLVSYFGGVNAGSVGWCHGTQYQRTDRHGDPICDPLMAKIGMVPWMAPDHKPKPTCP